LTLSSDSGPASVERESAWQANVVSSVDKSPPSHPDPNTDATRNSDRAGTSVPHHVEHFNNLEPILECVESSESDNPPPQASSVNSSSASEQHERSNTAEESHPEAAAALVQPPLALSLFAQSNVKIVSCSAASPIDLETNHALTASQNLLLPPAPPSPTLSARSVASNASAISVTSNVSMLSSLSSLSARARAMRVQRQLRNCDSPVSTASATSSFCDPRHAMLERADRERRQLLRLAPNSFSPHSPISAPQAATSAAHRDAEQRESFLAPDSTGAATPPPSAAHRVMQQSLDSITARLRSMQLARALAQSGSTVTGSQPLPDKLELTMRD
jgi:hypothetical protein